MRAKILGAGAVLAGAAALPGCGGDAERPADAPAPTPTARHAAAPEREAPEAIYMYRVLGDDPLPDIVSIRRDGTALVKRGGGHGGSEINEVVLPRREQRRVLWLARRAPLRILAHNTIEPGGFGGNDNAMRYLIRRGHTSVGVQQGDIPKRIRPLVRELDRIIEFDVGHVVHRSMQSGVDLG